MKPNTNPARPIREQRIRTVDLRELRGEEDGQALNDLGDEGIERKNRTCLFWEWKVEKNGDL